MCQTTFALQMKSQNEITVRNDLSLEDRLAIYRVFFIFCMTGHVTVLPMGATSAWQKHKWMLLDDDHAAGN